MKKQLLVFVGFVAAISVLWAGVASAAYVRSDAMVTIAGKDVVDSSVYLTGETVLVDGTVKGDVYCAAQSVEITGTVEGDVLCAGQSVRVSGDVKGDVRVAGQTITLEGNVDGSVTAVGQAVTVSDSANIDRDLTVTSQGVTIAGNVGRDITGSVEQLTLNATVGRDVDMTATSLVLGSTSVIDRNFTYFSEQEARIPDSAKINGKTEHKGLPVEDKMFASEGAMQAVGAAYTAIAMLLIGLTLVLVVPRGLDATTEKIHHRAFWSFGLGVFTLVTVPVVAFMASLTIVGIPLAFGLIFAWAAALLASIAVAAHSVGVLVVRQLHWTRSPRLAAVVLGHLVLFILGLVPLIGGMVIFAALVWGLGAIAYALGEHVRKPGASKPNAKLVDTKAKSV